MSDQKLGQVLEKPCVSSRGHIFNPTIMKVGQNVCLDKISDELENESCRVRNKFTRSNRRKTMFVIKKSRTGLKTGHVQSKSGSICQILEKPCQGSKTRSPGQIVERPCVCFRGHNFSSIIMKLGQNVCLDETSDEFKKISC